MSGTSADGVDAALVEIDAGKVRFREAATQTFEEPLQNRLLSLNDTDSVSLTDLVRLDLEIAHVFADTATELVQVAGGADAVIAIGSHGQTIFHQPAEPFPGTLQIGNASVIAQRTGVDTVADFRSADMACGGQGAPLTPAFNHAVFKAPHPRVILNLGGIANVTFLAADTLNGDTLNGETRGFDTGPANTLLDAWTKKHLNQPYDRDGEWARGGAFDDILLNNMLSDPYFNRAPPKSTGPDYFNLAWLESKINAASQAYEPKDVQATLIELTAISAAQSILQGFPEGVEILLCGGGSHNAYLVERMSAHCHGCTVTTTEKACGVNEKACGVNVDHCESIAFAWLAYRYMAGLPGNLPAVTGASKAVVLGALHKAT